MALNYATDQTFNDEVVNQKGLTVVDFWAEWCGPCRMIGPVFEALSKDYEGKIKFVKVNIDENPDTPMRFGIRSIPTLLIFKDGKVIKNQVGALSQTAMDSWLKESLTA